MFNWRSGVPDLAYASVAGEGITRKILADIRETKEAGCLISYRLNKFWRS
jgi:hypothetical protein